MEPREFVDSSWAQMHNWPKSRNPKILQFYGVLLGADFVRDFDRAE